MYIQHTFILSQLLKNEITVHAIIQLYILYHGILRTTTLSRVGPPGWLSQLALGQTHPPGKETNPNRHPYKNGKFETFLEVDFLNMCSLVTWRNP